MADKVLINAQDLARDAAVDAANGEDEMDQDAVNDEGADPAVGAALGRIPIVQVRSGGDPNRVSATTRILSSF